MNSIYHLILREYSKGDSMIILHTLKKSDWQNYKDKEYYGSDSIKKFGFIHCSDIKDIVEVADSNYVGIGDMVLLCIDPTKIKKEIKYEDLRNCGVMFPHIYGELNTDSIIKVLDFTKNDKGTFVLPIELMGYNL